MGNDAVIKTGEVQVMSAGTGVRHSEMNNTDQTTKFLQIWVIPNKRDVKPRYDQIELSPEDRKDKLQQVLSPYPEDEGVWAYQNAWFHMGDLNKGTKTNYQLKDSEKNGVYAFVLQGSATINGQALEHRGGFGVWNTDEISIEVDSDAEILLMEVPMS